MYFKECKYAYPTIEEVKGGIAFTTVVILKQYIFVTVQLFKIVIKQPNLTHYFVTSVLLAIARKR